MRRKLSNEEKICIFQQKIDDLAEWIERKSTIADRVDENEQQVFDERLKSLNIEQCCNDKNKAGKNGNGIESEKNNVIPNGFLNELTR